VSGGRVERWISIGVGTAVVCGVGWLTLQQNGAHARKEPFADGGVATSGSAASASSGVITNPTAILAIDASAPALDSDAGLSMTFLGDAGGLLGLPTSAPKTVHLGVVLVAYVGAEGASSNARTKAEAFTLAQKLREEAATDFKKAVKDGDSGSLEDIGRIPRGVLDPRSEVSVFSLGAGEISEILETPKGYWIVKRLD
jgi:hypothetical protein